MGILNIQKVPSWVILNIHEAKSWVLWIFMKWRHGHFECSKADVKCKYSWNDLGVFWIFKSWRHGHFEYLWGDVGILITKWRYGIIQKLTPWVFWIFIVTLLVLIFIQNYVVFWIFIVMTSLQEYSKYQCHYEFSKYPWRQLLIFPWRHFVSIQNIHGVSLWIFKLHVTSLHACSKNPWRRFWIFKIPMTSAWIFIKLPLTSWILKLPMRTSWEKKTNYITRWIFKIPMASAFEYSNYPWSILNIHEVTSLVFWIFTAWEYSKADVMGILECSWSDVMGILNIQKKCNFEYVTWIFCFFFLNILEVCVMSILNIQKKV